LLVRAGYSSGYSYILQPVTESLHRSLQYNITI
jgi:hypothetical protein